MTAHSERFEPQALARFAADLFVAAGLSSEKAEIVSAVLIEADLLGYSTHGLQRLDSNLEWLIRGETHPDGALAVINDRGAAQVWDADFLPGPWVTTLAVREASDRARKHGIASIAIRRSQHVACLAAYLEQATSNGLMVLMTASSPSEVAVAAHGGTERIFSCNPIAVGIPTDGDPILIDTSASMSALGPLFRSYRSGVALPVECIVKGDGSASRDGADFVDGDGAILPTGGLEQGFKGFGLCLLTEALSAALTGFGRADNPQDGESNAVFVLVIDPEAFAGGAAFRRQMHWLAEKCRNSLVAPGSPAVRVPGDRGLSAKRAQLGAGVILAPPVVEAMRRWAERFGIAMPRTLQNAA